MKFLLVLALVFQTQGCVSNTSPTDAETDAGVSVDAESVRYCAQYTADPNACGVGETPFICRGDEVLAHAIDCRRAEGSPWFCCHD